MSDNTFINRRYLTKSLGSDWLKFAHYFTDDPTGSVPLSCSWFFSISYISRSLCS